MLSKFRIIKNIDKPIKMADTIFLLESVIANVNKHKNIFPIILNRVEKVCLFNEFLVNPLSEELNIAKVIKETKANTKEKIITKIILGKYP